MKVEEALRSVGLEGSEDLIAAAILDSLTALDHLLKVRPSWTANETRLLRAGGLDLQAPSVKERNAWMTAGAEAYAHLVASSYSVTDVASCLGVDSSRVRQRLADRTLFGFKVRRQWRLPRWQFLNGEEVPALGEVLSTLALDDPISVSGFFVTPTLELTIDGEPMAPIEWLLAGRSADRVKALGASLVMA